MRKTLEEIDRLIQKYDKPLNKEQIQSVIFNTFAIIIFLLPILPEIIGVCLYSLKNTIFNLVTIVTSVTLIILNIKQIKKYKWNIYDVLLSIYLILVALSTVFTKYGILKAILGSNGRGEGLITIFSYVATFCIFSKGYKYIKKTVKFALIGAIIVCIYSFIQANVPLNVELPFTPNRSEGIATGTMRNQNFLSSYICIFLPAMCYYYINSKSHKSLVVVGMLFATLVYTVTLGGYITFFAMYMIVAIFCMCYSKNRKNTLKRIMIVVLTVITIFVGIECIDLTIKYPLSSGQTNSQTNEQSTVNKNKYIKEVLQASKEVKQLANKSERFGSGRMEIWRGSLAIVKNNILLGTGPDSMYPETRKEQYMLNGEQDVFIRCMVDKAHSEPLHIALTTGLPSAIIYLLFASIVCLKLIILLIKKIKLKGTKDNNNIYIGVILVSILSYLMQSMINISVVQVAPVFWAILGIGAGITLNENSKSTGVKEK